MIPQGLGEAGKQALYETGKKFGSHFLNSKYRNVTVHQQTSEQKINILRETSVTLGLEPEFTYDETAQVISFKIFNCPFKELAFSEQNDNICEMHRFFIRGMFEQLFPSVTLEEEANMVDGCEACMYKTKLSV
ncbi:hypothetical protein GCM10008986_04000 [Salinibacillus aidingensis]|uniref:Metanogen output domain-containing protein n=1 Tax=Salinibacillus aidingensis TaxID=237684 RepID=A0ABN1ARD1_9BACI